MVYFIYPSRFQGHLSYFYSIVAKLCSTDHQSCQEPETLSVGHFFQKKLLDLCESDESLIVVFSWYSIPLWVCQSINCNKWFLVYLNILTQSIAITDSMFNFGNFLTKKRYNFWSKRDRKKINISRRHEISLRIQCCHKKCQNRKKKNQLFSQNIFNKIAIFKKNTDF